MSLYDAADYFVGDPQKSCVIAVFFALLPLVGAAIARNKKSLLHWAAPLAAVAWFLFGLNEYYAKKHGWNIRVDLLLSWPLMAIGTIACLFFWLKMILKDRK